MALRCRQETSLILKSYDENLAPKTLIVVDA